MKFAEYTTSILKNQRVFFRGSCCALGLLPSEKDSRITKPWKKTAARLGSTTVETPV